MEPQTPAGKRLKDWHEERFTVNPHFNYDEAAGVVLNVDAIPATPEAALAKVLQDEFSMIHADESTWNRTAKAMLTKLAHKGMFLVQFELESKEET